MGQEIAAIATELARFAATNAVVTAGHSCSVPLATEAAKSPTWRALPVMEQDAPKQIAQLMIVANLVMALEIAAIVLLADWNRTHQILLNASVYKAFLMSF